MKDTVIKLMRRVGRLPIVPFPVVFALAQRYRQLRFLLPPNREFVYQNYLGHLSVNVDTTYLIEVEMATGLYDPKTSAIIQQYVSEHDVVMDIGANVGALTLLMATIARHGKVIAVEPGPTTSERLRRNLDLNPELEPIVDLYPIGIADKAGTLFWKEDAAVPGNAGLLEDDGHRVDVKTLDQLTQELGLERLDFIKIDVEGMEYEVILGGQAAIARYRPIIYYETLESFRTIRGFDLYNAIFARLKALDYRQFSVLADGQISEVHNLDSLNSPNTLAIPAEQRSLAT